MTQEMLIFLKPDGVIRRYCGARALKSLMALGITINFFGMVKPSKEFLADKHYAEHKGKFFYQNLVNYINVSELGVIIASGEDIISRVRELLGKTMCEKADPNSVRGRYGTTMGINLVHASDSPETASREVNLWEEIINRIKGKDYAKDVLEYISKYENFPMIDPIRYREISKELATKRADANRFVAVIKDLLSKETDIKPEYVDKLSNVTVENVLLG
jgi:nucleoside-diphosphate kinase